MEGCSLRAALEESFAADRQARNARQLTWVATVIVPCTFVASVFSMGGSFAAGEDLFYVYWAISVPVTIVLLTWVLQAVIWKRWNDQKTKIEWDREKANFMITKTRLHGGSGDLEQGGKES